MIVSFEVKEEQKPTSRVVSLGVKLHEHPEKRWIFFLTELFRSVLREVYPDGEYRLDIIKREEESNKLPH